MIQFAPVPALGEPGASPAATQAGQRYRPGPRGRRPGARPVAMRWAHRRPRCRRRRGVRGRVPRASPRPGAAKGSSKASSASRSRRASASRCVRRRPWAAPRGARGALGVPRRKGRSRRSGRRRRRGRRPKGRWIFMPCTDPFADGFPEIAGFLGGPRARSSGALRGGRLPGAGRWLSPSRRGSSVCAAAPQTLRSRPGSGAATSVRAGLPRSPGRPVGLLALNPAGVGSKGAIGPGPTDRLGDGLSGGREAPQGHSCCAWPGCRAFGARGLRDWSDQGQRLRDSETIGAQRRSQPLRPRRGGRKGC
jgi:hypothetical protein